MKVKVKICGLTREEDVEAALEYGADALGFILYPKSPRYVPPDRLKTLLALVPPFVQTVGVGVNLTPDEILFLEKEVWLNLYQLHGVAISEILSTLPPRRLIRSYGLPDSSALDEAETLKVKVAGFHLDKASPQHGGTGETFDWSLAVEFAKKIGKPIILAGGLNAGNVAEAIRVVRPYAIDVSSGVEVSPGRKDPGKLKDFIQICRQM